MLIIFGRKQMASLLFTLLSSLLGAGINATAFAGASLGFSMLRDDGGKERKRHDLAEEELQKARDEWNEDRIKRLDFINKRLREQNKARVNDIINDIINDFINDIINDTNEAMLEYYRIFAKKIKPSPPEPQLSDFYHASEAQKIGELLLVAVGTGIATYALYKYLK